VTTRICVICARGGSKGVPGKNIRPLAGKPLIAWSVEQAKESGLFAIVAVSSDSADILEASRAAGADLLVERPAELATDTVSSIPAMEHCLRAAEAALGRECEVLVALQPTSPTRAVEDIAGAVALLEESGADSVITGQPARNSPYFSLVERAPDGAVALAKTLDRPIVRRQDAPECFDMNGSVYVWRRAAFIANPAVFQPVTRLYAMPEERSVDIDTELDFALAELVMQRRG